MWLEETVTGCASEPHFIIEKMRGISVTVQFHPHHRAGLPKKLIYFVGTAADAIVQAHHSEDDAGLVEHP